MDTSLYVTYAVLLASLSVMTSGCLGQAGSRMASDLRGLSVGVSAGHHQYDPALGIDITSPRMFADQLSLRVKINHTWLEQYKAQSDQWAAFNTFWVGLMYNIQAVDRARILPELGTFTISPNEIFSSRKFHTGYYGSVGVELFVGPDNNKRFAYFLSGGFAFINAHADKMEDSPRYGHGTIFTNGLRYYF